MDHLGFTLYDDSCSDTVSISHTPRNISKIWPALSNIKTKLSSMPHLRDSRSRSCGCVYLFRVFFGGTATGALLMISLIKVFIRSLMSG
jgi:hypothetical protein